MKLLKNKKHKLLAAAVTASLVLGISGSAMAEKSWYLDGNYMNSSTWAEYRKEFPVYHNKSGEWDKEDAYIIYGGIDPVIPNWSSFHREVDKIKVTILKTNVIKVYGGYSIETLVNNNAVEIKGGTVATAYGGYSGKVAARNNSVTISGGSVFRVYGGQADNWADASENTVSVNGGNADIIYGGSAYKADAHHNTVNLISGTVTSVYGGDSSEGAVYNNTVNLYGKVGIITNGVKVSSGIYGGMGPENKMWDNTLNVYGTDAYVPQIGYFPKLNFNADTATNNSTMLTAGKLENCNIDNFNTVINVANYKPGTTITLLSTEDKGAVAQAKNYLTINGQRVKEIPINVPNLSPNYGPAVGYDVLDDAIKLTTRYTLQHKIDVTENINLKGVLYLNNKTLDMQYDPDDTPEYNTFTANKIYGEGKLTIDANLATGNNDKIKISGNEANAATITLNSIIVRKDLPGADDQELLNKLSVIEGNLDGIALKVADGSISSATSDYIYTFTKGTEEGKVNVTKESAKKLALTISDFIQGKDKYADVNSYTLDENVTVKADLGETNRDKATKPNDKAITVAFAEGKILSGDGKAGGVTVADGYSLKLQGLDEKATGIMTQFATAATVKENGTLDVENITFVGNKQDIDNKEKGTLNLAGNNTISEISNEGAANVDGSNTITTVRGNGTFNVEAGKTIVNSIFSQNTLNVKAGELYLNGDAYADTVNISGGKVKGKLIGRPETNGGTDKNVLNISGSDIQVEDIADFEELNFTLPKGIKDGKVMLTLTDSEGVTSLEGMSVNTKIDNYTPGTTVTLLSDTQGIDKADATLKLIKGEAVTVDTATMDTAVEGLSEKLAATVGYDITAKEINLTTKSYELQKDTNVTKDVTLKSELNLNDKTLNMQSDSEEKDSYNTLTVENLINSANLAIDIDMATGESDKINITGDEKANNATINLNSIIVRKDLQEDPKEGGIGKADYVTVVDGKIGGTTLNLFNDSIKTATTKYVYKFTKGNAGKLTVNVERPGTFADFIPGTVGSVYENINTYTLTEDVVAEKELGTTYRANKDNNVITLAFNKGVSLSGQKVTESEESAKSVEGVTVEDSYTLKLQGEDAETPGVMTQFKTAAVTNNGILEVENMRFEGNEKDIINNKALKLSGTNSINDITNDGTAKLEGKNTITTVKGTGSFDVEAGETNVNGAFAQDKVTVNGGTLALNGDINASSLKVTEAGSLEIGGTLNSPKALENAGTVTMYSDNTLASVTSTDGNAGSFNVAAGKTVTVEEAIAQKDVNVNTNGKLLVKGNTKVTGTMKNAGTVSLNGSEIAMLNNNGTAELNGTNKLESVVGTGTFNVESGKTTVSGAFAQKELNVEAEGTLEQNGREKSFVEGYVKGNIANINGGTVVKYVFGGASIENAFENTVNIREKSTVNGDVYGAVSYDGDAYGNIVNISGGTISDEVYGGISYNGDAHKNIVNITGGTIGDEVYGGFTLNKGTAYENTINISGGTVKGNVYAGIGKNGNNSVHHDNVVNISGGTVEKTIFGGSSKVEANNLLHVTGSNTEAIKVGNIANFQKLEFALPQGYKNESALLTLTGKEATSLNLNGEGSIVLSSDPGERLTKGDEVTLIQKTNDEALNIKVYDNVIFKDGALQKEYKNTALYVAGPMYIFKGELTLEAKDGDKAENDLVFKVGNHILDDDEPVPIPKPEPQPTPEPEPQPEPTPDIKPDDKPITPVTPDEPVKPEPKPEPKPVDPIDYDKVYNELADNVKTALETRANGAALLNEDGDFLMKQGLSNAKMAAAQSKAEGNSSMAPFVALGGGKLRYETGSHVDSKSWHGAVGLAKEVKGLTFGVAIQQGKSNYDAYVNKAHSEGNSKSVGGALFAEKKTASGLHFDAAVRAGRVKNDYNARVTYSIPGDNTFDVRFKESSAFYGISLGGGKEFNLKNQDRLDVYGRYAWTHTGSSDAMTNWQDDLKFDGINSHRILLGGRYTHAVDDKNELYAGLGWQYELGGKVKGSVYGYSIPEPSLKGSSGLLELGWKAAVEENFAVDLNLSGWTGKQRGAMAGVNMQWKF